MRENPKLAIGFVALIDAIVLRDVVDAANVFIGAD
jgi:hypothetical protein